MTLPEASSALAKYSPVVLVGDLMHISGQLPRDAEGNLITGKVPANSCLEMGLLVAASTLAKLQLP